jgi:hypothetical protein
MIMMFMICVLDDVSYDLAECVLDVKLPVLDPALQKVKYPPTL